MVARKFFGTDGIRGRANTHPMRASVALSLGKAAGHYFRRGSHRHRVVIAKDTRLSGYMIEPALTAGFIASGMDVILVGPMPTPAVAMLTRSMRADLGVMISASHNPYYDNGIKLFGPDGYKLSDEAELEIERLMETLVDEHLTESDKLGRAKRIEDARGRYIEFAKATFPKELDLTGMKIVIDCAHGAAYQVGPIILRELGAEVIAIGTEPNGFNINDKVGSTHPQALVDTVVLEQADIGIALDGDADRLILCDEKGQLLDGDQIMALVATDWQQRGLLRGDAVVATQMSNLGLERYLKSLGLGLIRTGVGDRYVLEGMQEHGCNLGGEQSGHILMTDYSTTGDGLVAALQVLALIARREGAMSESGRLFEPLPQLLQNVRYEQGTDPLSAELVKQAIEQAEVSLEGRGRLLIRKSGTEPLIRVMAEGEDDSLIQSTVQGLCSTIEKVANGA